MTNNPKNGHERVITNNKDTRHLEIFMNGRWMHSEKCREYTNKECKIKT
jgi:hypothetical protein